MRRFPSTPFKRALLVLAALGAACSADLETTRATASRLGPADAASSYRFAPLRLGAGGFVTGFVVHPLDSNVRYARTDVGNAYRWDATSSQWLPMKVSNDDGSGVPSPVASAPSNGGEDSVAVDPTNTSVVYLAFPTSHSNDVGGSAGDNVYRSTDGGKTFTAGNLNVPGDTNGPTRTLGERLAVDPNDGAVVYYGTPQSGLYRSLDSGATWNPVAVGGGPASNANVINVLIPSGAGTSTIGGVKSSSVVFAVVASGDVYQSTDGGSSWSDVSSGQGIAGQAGMSTVDAAGSLYVAQTNARAYFRYASGAWTSVSVPLDQPVQNVVVDPKRPARMFAVGYDGGIARSLDGGATWTNLGPIKFANTLGWLPEKLGGTWRSNGGISLDRDGNLWQCQGNEGTLQANPADTDTVTSWTIASKGIEELVTHDVLLPKGGGDRVLVAVEDATGLVASNPDDFGAKQIPLQDQLISDGYSLAACPGDPSYVVVSSSDINYTGSGENYSGYSTDGGTTWKRFTSVPTFHDGTGKTQTVHAGNIAVSRRGAWSVGADHLVMLPNYGQTIYFSKDGGATWAPTTTFPTNADNTLTGGFEGLANIALKSRQLQADPFVPDTFYLKLKVPGSLYVSTDGGQTWNPKATTLPNETWHGQLAADEDNQGSLWFADGWEGATAHGLWHSTDGGGTFMPIAQFSNVVTLALGKGGGGTGDSTSTVYVYGKEASDPAWGIFRSRDAGVTWDRIAKYPGGVFDQPTSMAASWDTFGLVYVGFNGNSFVYGKLVDDASSDGGTTAADGASTIEGGASVAPPGIVTDDAGGTTSSGGLAASAASRSAGQASACAAAPSAPANGSRNESAVPGALLVLGAVVLGGRRRRFGGQRRIDTSTSAAKGTDR